MAGIAGIYYVGSSTSIEIKPTMHDLVLFQNVPNPCNPTTTISFVLPERSQVKLAIYDVQGRLVRTLINDVVQEGRQERLWEVR